MEYNDELVDMTENVEELTTEENPTELEDVEDVTSKEETVEEPKEEMFTKAQLEEIVKKRLGRQKDKIRKEYENKYSRLENVVNAGLGTNNTDEAVDKLTEFYKSKGIDIPDEPRYSDRDLEVLAEAEANDIISDGYDEIVDEVDRLAKLGDKMSQRDKLIFTKLATKRKELEDTRDLASIGVTELDSGFKEFEAKWNNPNISLKEKYEMYLTTKQKQENKIIGSQRDGATSQKKEYYTDKELNSLSLDDLDNDEVWEAVRKSMTSR